MRLSCTTANNLPVERRKVTPVDTGTSTSIVECLSGIPYVEASTFTTLLRLLL